MIIRRELLKTTTAGGAALALGDPWMGGSARAAGQDDVARRLHGALIWCAEHAEVPVRGDARPIADVAPELFHLQVDRHAVFVKAFDLADRPASGVLNLFAYTRYRLYLNGAYVGRGPSRYQNQRPEYDSWDLADHLRAGRNVISVLVHRDGPTGRIMAHEPGLAVVLVCLDRAGNETSVASDETWRATPERGYGPRDVAWGSIEEHIDARLMPDWTAEAFDADAWPAAVRVGGDSYAPFWPRTIPLQREATIPWRLGPNFPVALKTGDTLNLDLDNIIQGYHRLRLDADAGTEIELAYQLPEGNESGRSTYVARQGQQTYDGGDTFGFNRLSLHVKSGRLTLIAAEARQVRYPFDRLGAFDSGDDYLNRLWSMCARSLEVLSEDAYVDCADRERVEWTDGTPPAFDVTRVMMAGGSGKDRRNSDPRLLKALLQRIVLTQKSDGQIKAHSCSERWDIHAIMEDRSCDWVMALRQYFDATDDVKFVSSVWAPLTRLMRWFLGQRTARGLILAREWEVWDNPLRYQVCEGAGLNAFVYHALKDAAYLGQRAGYRTEAARFSQAADALGAAINTHLWDETEGSYYGGLFAEGSVIVAMNGAKLSGPLLPGGYHRPTLQAALYALDAGLVPAARADRVKAFILAHIDDASAVMTHHYLFKALYAVNSREHDIKVLELMRSKWRPMVESPWGTSWEDLNGAGSQVHIYGMAPAYFLSAYVLGVRADGPVRERVIVVEPRPGDLRQARGAVVTAFGVTPIEWSIDDQARMRLKVTIPDRCHGRVRLPVSEKTRRLNVNGRLVAAKIAGGQAEVRLPSGTFAVTT